MSANGKPKAEGVSPVRRNEDTMTTDTIATTARELADALDWINADTDVRDAFPGVAVEDLETILSVMRALTAAMAGE